MQGGCYCGAIRYEIGEAPMLKAQCHCRPCQYISGGGPNIFMLLPKDGLTFTEGTPQEFTHPKPDNPVTRAFCGTCGTHLITRLPGDGRIVVKVGTLDDPALFGRPAIAIYCEDKQAFHAMPEALTQFEKLPPRA